MSMQQRILLLLVAMVGLTGVVMPARAQDDAAIDMKRAQALHQRQARGVALTSEEKEYLDRAMEARQQGRKQRKRGEGSMNPTEGDNLDSNSAPHVPGIDIPESISPLKEVQLQSPDGVDLSFVYRTPPGKGLHPAILFFHGGGDQAPLDELKKELLNQPVQTRFLEKGFVIVQCTRRPYWKSKNKGPHGFYDAVNDAVMIVEKTKTLPGVDPCKVILFGGSGGGILAIVTASKTDVSCVIAGEPATCVPLDPMTEGRGGGRAYQPIMENPREFFAGERKAEILGWMKEINCPILILQGKPVLLYRVNFEILIPEMKKLGKDISSISFPGLIHGFYWGKTQSGATLEVVEKLMEDMTQFIEKGKRTKMETQEETITGANSKHDVQHSVISKEKCPPQKVTVSAKDGRTNEFCIRKPPGEGPFPAVIVHHGGGRYNEYEKLERSSMVGKVQTRLLALGYLVANATTRNFRDSFQDEGAVWDSLSVVDYVKQMKEVDQDSIVMFGGSCGGYLALRVAGITKLAAIGCAEPDGLIFAGKVKDANEDRVPITKSALAEDPSAPDLYEERYDSIMCPVYIVHSDVHDINVFNAQYMIPKLRKAGKDVTTLLLPGMNHGFFWGFPKTGITAEMFDKQMSALDSFYRKNIRIPPKPFFPATNA